MKKALILILIAFVAVSSAFAFEFRSIGLETGEGILASGDMILADNFDLYARLGYNGQFALSAGAQYKATDFDVQGTKIDVKPGAQINLGFGDGFTFSLLATCQFAFEAGHFGAFARPGLGFGIYSYSYTYGGHRYSNSDSYFTFTVETGVYYIF